MTAALDVTLDDLFARCFDGMMVVALDATNLDPVPITAVKSGAGCGCVCPVCYGDLVARKGAVRKHSFAHGRDSHGVGCAHAAESILHRLAKTIIAREMRIDVPDTVVEDELGPLVVSKGRVVSFDTVELEKRVDHVVPDVVCTAGGRKLHVEFRVSHPCPADKLEKLALMGVSVVEIDLSAYRKFKLKELGFIILEEAPRRMLLSPMFERGPGMLAERIRRMADELSCRMAGFSPTRAREERFSSRLHRQLISPFMVETMRGIRMFEIADLEWQSWILYSLLKRPDDPPTTAELVGAFRKNGWVADFEKIMVEPVIAELRRRGRKAMSLEEVVTRFLGHMEAIGLAAQTPEGRWKGTSDLVSFEKNRRIRRGGRPTLGQRLIEKGVLDHRKAGIAAAVTRITERLFPDMLIDADGWIVDMSRALGITPYALAVESYLLEELRDLEKDVVRGCVTDRPMLGVPYPGVSA